MFLKKLKKMATLYKILVFGRFRYFKVDGVMELISQMIFSIGNILFWYCVTEMGYELSGWSLNQIFVFVAYSELFFSFESSIFGICSRFWNVVYSGSLDVFLTKPIDCRLRFVLLNMSISSLINGIIKFVVLLIIANYRFSSVASFVLSIFILILAAINLGVIHFIFSYASFWIGKMDAINEVADSLRIFNKYPLLVLPKAAQIICSIILPFYFFSTFPSQVVLEKVTLQNGVYGCLVLCITLCMWIGINGIIWKRGLMRYEGING